MVWDPASNRDDPLTDTDSNVLTVAFTYNERKANTPAFRRVMKPTYYVPIH